MQYQLIFIHRLDSENSNITESSDNNTGSVLESRTTRQQKTNKNSRAADFND